LQACFDVQGKYTQNEGTTPLHKAAAGGHVDVVRRLVEAGSNPRVSSIPIHGHGFSGLTPLHLAASGRHVETVRYLIEAGANVDDPDNVSKCLNMAFLSEQLLAR
jgi:ankyrin repeat protein